MAPAPSLVDAESVSISPPEEEEEEEEEEEAHNRYCITCTAVPMVTRYSSVMPMRDARRGFSLGRCGFSVVRRLRREERAK